MQLPAQVRRIALFMGFKPPYESDDFTSVPSNAIAFTPATCEATNFTSTADAHEQASYQVLLDELAEIKQRLDTARSHFDFDTDFDLVEADIFRISELEARYGHKLKQIKASYRRNMSSQPA